MLQVSQQVDTATTSKEAQSIMNLNLRLQSTAAKMQNKAIDIELKKLEAAQLSEHLRIVQVSYIELMLDRTDTTGIPTRPVYRNRSRLDITLPHFPPLVLKDGYNNIDDLPNP